MTMEELIIRNIKTLGIDMIKKAGSGHPGIPEFDSFEIETLTNLDKI